MNRDVTILRELAARYFEYANSDENRQRILLHKATNDLHMIRPTLLISEIPWHEMNFDGSLTLQCQDPFYRTVEETLRRTLFQWEKMPADMVLPPYFRVEKLIETTGMGVGTVVKSEKESQDVQAHLFEDQLQEMEDLEKLHNEVITYNEAATKSDFQRVADAFGDILPVKICGESTGYYLGCRTWDIIVNMRGLENIFYDMYEDPDLIHATVRKLTDIFLDKVRQYEELGLLDGDAYYNHCASALTDDLHPDQAHVRTKDIWGRGLAQILASVSPAMHDEFDIQYMIKAMEPFGLVYYGCCEPLDAKIDILRQIPNLRKISITPWADVDRAAAQIQKTYVMSAKPNPATVASSTLDVDAARKEMEKILNAAKRNGCHTELLMKDITTVGGNAKTLIEWEHLAMDMIRNF